MYVCIHGNVMAIRTKEISRNQLQVHASLPIDFKILCTQIDCGFYKKKFKEEKRI